MRTITTLLILGSLSGAASAASFNLANYTSEGVFALADPGSIPPTFVLNSEASAVTYNGDTDTLFVIGDEGEFLVEVDRQGNTLSSMALTGFADTEGLTYIGGGKFLIAEERDQDGYEIAYTSGGSVDRGDLDFWDIGPTVGNIGLEGISYAADSDLLYGVKEKSAQAFYEIELLAPPNAAVGTLVVPAGLQDLSDIQVLSGIAALVRMADAENFLILSQESKQLVEVDVDGNVLSEFDLGFFSDNAEGVTVDSLGNIYIVAETYFDPTTGDLVEAPALLALQAVPLPAAVFLFGAGLISFAGFARKRLG